MTVFSQWSRSLEWELVGCRCKVLVMSLYPKDLLWIFAKLKQVVSIRSWDDCPKVVIQALALQVRCRQFVLLMFKSLVLAKILKRSWWESRSSSWLLKNYGLTRDGHPGVAGLGAQAAAAPGEVVARRVHGRGRRLLLGYSYILRLHK